MNQLADPNELRKLPRLLRMVTWRMPHVISELVGKATYKPISNCINKNGLVEFISERGETIDETAVTTGQREILFRALSHTAQRPEAIAEVGAWRGITTAALAERTARKIYAIDPHKKDEFPGINEAFEIFQSRISRFPNIVHIRNSSGDAARQLAGTQFSLIFIDAIHTYVNTWYDFVVWGNLLASGGIIIFHDVDDHPGTNLAARRILRRNNYRVWGYCPNIVAFQKIA